MSDDVTRYYFDPDQTENPADSYTKSYISIKPFILEADHRRIVEGLAKRISLERGCKDCWKGVSCGKDCHMNDIAEMVAPHD